MRNNLKRALSIWLCIVIVVAGFFTVVNVVGESENPNSWVIEGDDSSTVLDNNNHPDTIYFLPYDGTIYNNLSVVVTTNCSTCNVGDVVEMKLYVEQLRGSETYTFFNAQRYDFELYKNGMLVWRWSDGMFFASVIGSAVLSPTYPSETYYDYWDSTGAEPGIYNLIGIWTCSDPLEDPFDITQFQLFESSVFGISADVDVKPESMNNVEHGKFTIFLEVLGYNISDIDQESIVLLNSTAQPTKIIMDWDLNRLILKYWRSEAYQQNGWYTIEGLLFDGNWFRGGDYEPINFTMTHKKRI